MSERDEWNRKVIDEFRANEGKVGGMFEGMPIALVHHRGAKSGTERINPLAYQRLSGDAVAVFASAGGQRKNPDWYHNLVANPDVTVEIGTDTFPARARVAGGKERDRIWNAQTETNPSFAEYEEKSGRAIPVVILEKT
jgi:deazaflavin-dependent oxidoreductase (nitroreductase family)